MTDTIFRLDEIEVYAKESPGMVKFDKNGQLSLQRGDLQKNLRIAGFSDAINALSSLPGITSGSDYSSGVSINGAGYDQISYTYADAPLFFPYHFGGFMSTFNTNHLSSVKINRAYSEIYGPDRLGGSVVVTPIGSNNTLHGVAECGIIASSATIKLPFGLSLSGRISYLNELFPWLINIENTDIRYRLSDINLTYSTSLSAKDFLDINILGSNDRLRYEDSGFGMKASMKWYNNLASATYRHTDRLRCTIYYSGFGSDPFCAMPQINLEIPSSLSQAGVWALWNVLPYLDLGWRTEITANTLQMPKNSLSNELPSVDFNPKPTSLYNKLHARYYNSFGSLSYEVATSVSKLDKWILPNAKISLSKDWGAHSVSFSADVSSQYISQIGMSDIGLATNFWVVANEFIKPSRSYGLNCVVNNNWADGLFTNSIEIYGKKIINEPEFIGSVFDLMNEPYNPYDHIIACSGYNVGASGLLKCNTHPVNGWLGVATGLSRRKYDDGKYHSSPFEIPLSLTLQVNWMISPKVGISGIFTAHSGYAYTGISSIYILAGNVILEYGDRNGSRLPAYHRLDLSCNYFLKNFKLGNTTINHFLNFSLLNVYGRKNVEFQYYRFNSKTNEIYLHQTHSLYRFLPSVSYTVEF